MIIVQEKSSLGKICLTTAGRNLEKINPIKIRLKIKNNMSADLFCSPHIPKTQSKLDLIKSDENPKM
jgi:hypothetical protein